MKSMQEYKYYTGVGSRTTPDDIIAVMKDIAVKMAKRKMVLRSGGASGADSAFENGAVGVGPMDIYFASDATKEAMAIAARYHPAWKRLSMYVKKLHGRNAFQVLGRNLDHPSKCLICWTPDGCERHADRGFKTGGTGTAISIADAYGVKVYNLKRGNSFKKWVKWLNKD